MQTIIPTMSPHDLELAVRNRLVFAKTILQLAETRVLTAQEVETGLQNIDEIVSLIKNV